MGCLKTQEVIDITDKLNDEWWKVMEEKTKQGGPVTWQRPFSVHTDGISIAVNFLEVTLWCDEDDPRVFNEEKNDYEPLEAYLRQEARAIAQDILAVFPS